MPRIQILVPDFGMEVVKATRIGLKPNKSAKQFVFKDKGEMS